MNIRSQYSVLKDRYYYVVEDGCGSGGTEGDKGSPPPALVGFAVAVE